MAMLRGLVLVILARACESTTFLQSDRYENNDCTGQLLRTEYIATDNCRIMSGNYFMWSCSGGNFTMTAYTDSLCTTVNTQYTPEETVLDTCDTSSGRKYPSCTAITAVATVQMFSTEDCSAANLTGTSMAPIGCRPTGRNTAWDGANPGEVMLMSSKVEQIGNDVVNTFYNSSLDCTGTYAQETFPCGAVCVNGSASEIVPAGTSMASTATCDVGTSGAVGKAFTGLMSLVPLVALQ